MARYHREIISEKPSSDGRGTIITEKDVRCTGSDCRHCDPDRHSRRPSKLDINNRAYSTVEERLPTPYEFDFRPDPAAKQRRHKSSRDHDRSHSDGDRYTLGRSNSTRGASDPIAIPRAAPRRSKSMYENDIYDKYYSDSARDSRYRPSIHQDSGYYRDSRYPPSRSARVPLGYEVLESSRPSKHSSDRRRSASPLDTPQKTDEYDPERRRLRSKSGSKSKHQPAVISYGADPLLPAFEPVSYGSSSQRRYSMDSSRSRSASFSASPPSKSVRWGDDPRLAQNQKISSRHSRRDSVSAGVGTGGDAGAVKGILKHNHPLTPPSSPPAVSSDQYDALYKSAQSIGVDERPTTPQRHVLQERSAEIEGLRQRISNYGMVDDHRYSLFESPPRRWGEKASSRGEEVGEVLR